MLDVKNTVLLVVDVQGKLAQLMHQRETLFTNLERVIKGAQLLNMPIIVTEQVPEKLGPTLPQFQDMLGDAAPPIAKYSFSCWGEENFVAQLSHLNRKQVLMAGIEAHICVFQTGADLLQNGYEVHAVTDAISSRTPENRAVGLDRLRNAGATMTSTEMSLFELMRVAEGDSFRHISKLVK